MDHFMVLQRIEAHVEFISQRLCRCEDRTEEGQSLEALA